MPSRHDWCPRRPLRAVRSDGNLAGEGLSNPLGRSTIDSLTVMLREAVQNSWDARIGGSIEFALRGYEISDPGTASSALFSNLPHGVDEETLPLLSTLNSGGVGTILAVSDRRTEGSRRPYARRRNDWAGRAARFRGLPPQCRLTA